MSNGGFRSQLYTRGLYMYNNNTHFTRDICSYGQMWWIYIIARLLFNVCDWKRDTFVCDIIIYGYWDCTCSGKKMAIHTKATHTIKLHNSGTRGKIISPRGTLNTQRVIHSINERGNIQCCGSHVNHTISHVIMSQAMCPINRQFLSIVDPIATKTFDQNYLRVLDLTLDYKRTGLVVVHKSYTCTST